MPLLLAQAQKLERNQLHQGIATEIVQRSSIYGLMPFIKLSGRLYQYVREALLPTAAFVAEDGSLSSTEPTLEEKTLDVTTLYTQGDYSGIAQAKGSNGDPRLFLIRQQAKSMANKLKDAIITGDGTSNSIKGVRQLAIDDSRDDIGSASTNGDAISFTLLRTLIDNMKNGVSAIVVSYRTHRAIRALYDALGGTVPQTVIQGYGPLMAFEGIPIIPDDAVAINETQGSSTNCARVHAVHFHDMDGLAAVFAGEHPLGLKVLDMGALESKDNYRIRLVWYLNMVNHSSYAVGSLKGITT